MDHCAKISCDLRADHRVMLCFSIVFDHHSSFFSYAGTDQGENNMGGNCGNILNNDGYACMLLTMAKGWVSAFSAQAGTTDSKAPFGVVTLADGGWEGNPANAGQMH